MTPPDPFGYPTEPHARKHAPAGYSNYQEYKPWLRDEFEFRCVYCLQRETWSREGYTVFSVDHVIPQAEDPALVTVYSNLVYACVRCNSARQDVRLPDPTAEAMGSHLTAAADGTLTALTDEGRLLIRLLHLNAAAAVRERLRIRRILTRRQCYPDDRDAEADFLSAFGYPEDLPDLRTLRPPGGNPLDANKQLCCFARREKGNLPSIY
jgi:hypothetical protein